jgi:hypothetical protein
MTVLGKGPSASGISPHPGKTTRETCRVSPSSPLPLIGVWEQWNSKPTCRAVLKSENFGNGVGLLHFKCSATVAEGAGKKLAGSLAAYSETIQAGLFYAIFVAIAMVSKIALLMVTPVLKRLTAES